MEIDKILKYQIKIYDRKRFIVHIPFLIILILTLLILINSFLFNENEFLKVASGIFINRKKYWSPEVILVAVFTLSVFWLSVLIEWIVDYIKKRLLSPPGWSLRKDLRFDCLNDLDIQGKVLPENNTLRLTSSSAGFLLKDNYWKDFKIIFTFNFEKLKVSVEEKWVETNGEVKKIVHKPRNNYFGLLFRAQDLNNYFMLSLGIKEIIKESVKSKKLTKKDYEGIKLVITPHIKLDGRWEVYQTEIVEGIKPMVNKDYILECKVKESVLELKLKDKGKILIKNYKWILPSEFRANYVDRDPEEYLNKDDIVIGNSNKIPFRDSYGKIGLRAYGDEYIVIKKLIIKRLPGTFN